MLLEVTTQSSGELRKEEQCDVMQILWQSRKTPAAPSIYRTFQAWTRSPFLDPVESQTVQTALTLSSREFSGSLTTVMLPWRTSPAGRERGSRQELFSFAH